MTTRSYLAAASLLVILGCREDTELPSGPSTPADPTGSTLSAAAGHKVVNSLADPGNGVCNAIQCTLREAIEDPTSTSITFAAGLTGPITLAAPDHGGGSLAIEKPLSITGPSGGMVIRRRSTDPAFRILRVGTDGVVSLTNLTLRNGRNEKLGGGIVNFGRLTLNHCTVDHNSTAGHGGGIDNHKRLTITNSTIADNSASVAGGIHNHNLGTLQLTGSTVTRNRGTGVYNDGSTIVLRDNTVSFNSGDGIFTIRGSDMIELTRILDNTGRGLIVAQGHLTLANSSVNRNADGGILNLEGTVEVSRSTIINNSTAGTGGGIFNTVENNFGRGSSLLTLTNSTVARNSAATGGGIQNSDRLGSAVIRVTNSTIAFNSAGNSGGGIRQEGAEENGNALVLVNSIVAKNSAPAGPDVSDRGDEGSFVTARFNLIGDGSGSGISNTDGNKVGVDPRLGPLDLHGGMTRNYSLLAGSPAIDAASSADCPARDQRGVTRPQGAGCDMGSFERQ